MDLDIPTRTGVLQLPNPRPWLRGPAKITDGWIELDAERSREYQPMEERDLLWDLAAAGESLEPVIFVARHGLLRHGPDADEHRERLEDFENSAWTIRYSLRLYLELRRALGNERREEGRKALRGELRPVLDHLFAQRANGDDELIAQAGGALARIASDGLAGTETGVDTAYQWLTDSGDPGPADLFMYSPRPPDLLGYAYYQLARDVLVNRAPVRTCEDCGRFFTFADPRQRFCTPTCASRVRQRRWQAKRAGERAS